MRIPGMVGREGNKAIVVEEQRGRMGNNGVCMRCDGQARGRVQQGTMRKREVQWPPIPPSRRGRSIPLRPHFYQDQAPELVVEKKRLDAGGGKAL